MKKRIISVIAALLVCAVLPIAAAADSQDYDYDVYAAEGDDGIAVLDENDSDLDEDIDLGNVGKSLFGYLVDEAELLTDDQISELKAKLEEMSTRLNFDFVVYIEPSYSGSYDDIQDFADDIFDFLGYGYGPDKDGALFLLCMEERQWHISTHGYGITAFTDYGIDRIRSEITPYLKDGDYYEALELFTQIGKKYVTSARDGEPFDRNSSSDDDFYDYDDGFYFSWFYAFVSLIVGVIGGFIGAGILRSKMRTVRPRNSAESYVRENSMVLNDSHDIFLYSTVSQTERPQDDDNDSGGGSSTHVSSSGETHGGGGGSF